MPKILYIEDELTKNIASIKKFFSPVVSKKKFIEKLDELENEDRLLPEDILLVCGRSSILDVCHTFPMALDRIVNNHEIYDLIIIDRNLSVYEYSDEMIDVINTLMSIGLDYDDDRLLSFYEREGDLLLLVLLRINPSYQDRVYYLTANTKDDLRGSADLQLLMDINQFTKDHIIEKGSVQENVISEILANFSRFQIQNRFSNQCDALRKQNNEYVVDQFIESIKHYDTGKWEDFAANTRKVLHNLLIEIATKINDPMGESKAKFWDDYNKLKVSDFLINSDYGLPKYFQKIGYNKIIRNFCVALHHICSAYGSHDDSDNELVSGDQKRSISVKLSSYTVTAILNMVCEVILWYDRTMQALA